jgi:hypothetical protein
MYLAYYKMGCPINLVRLVCLNFECQLARAFAGRWELALPERGVEGICIS